MSLYERRKGILEEMYALTHHMDDPTWNLFLSKMYIPFLNMLVQNEPRLPIKWIAQLPPRVPPTNCKRHHFYRLCEIAQAAHHSPEFNDRIRDQHHRLDMRMRAFKAYNETINRVVYETLDSESEEWARLNYLHVQASALQSNYGPIYYILAGIASFMNNTTPGNDPPRTTLDALAKRGLIDYALDTVPGILIDEINKPNPDAQTIENLDSLTRLLTEHVRAITDARLALAMALHPRLGSHSPLGGLKEEIFPKFAPADRFPRLILWHEVLGWEERWRG
jgi:hypothetical protein